MSVVRANPYKSSDAMTAEHAATMVSECAEVIELHQGGLTLKSRRPVACAKCERGEGCGGGLVGRLLRNPHQTLFVKTPPGSSWQVGQAIQLLIPASTVLRLAACAYGLPLLGLLIGAVLANFISTGNAWTILGAVAGLIGGIASARVCLRLAGERLLQPRLAPMQNNG